MVGLLVSVTIAVGLANAILTLLMWLDLREAKNRINQSLSGDDLDQMDADIANTFNENMKMWYSQEPRYGTTVTTTTKTKKPAKAPRGRK